MDLDQARRIKSTMLERIKVARNPKPLIRTYLSATSTKLDAAARVLGTSEEGSVARLAEAIDPFTPCQLPVRWWRVRKKAGGHRVVCSLPGPLKAAALMVKDVLQSRFDPPAHIYNLRGRGRDEEARAIKRVLERGYEWCFVGDIANCFDSVKPDILYELPLPRSVVRAVLDNRYMVFQHKPEKEYINTARDRTSLSIGYDDTHQMNGPLGLLPGSPVSNLILAWLLRDLPEVLPHDCEAFLLADNLLVAAPDQARCLELELTLAAYFREHPGGPFLLTGGVMPSAMGIDRAGYQFVKMPDGEVIIEPAPSNVERLHRRIGEMGLDDAAVAVEAWLSGHSALSDPGWHRSEALGAKSAPQEQGLDYVIRMLKSLPQDAQTRILAALSP